MKKKKIIKSGLLSAALLMGTGFAVVNSDNLNLNFWMEVPENSVSVNVTFITFGGENYEDESVEYDYSDGLDITFDSSQEYKGGDVWFNMDLGNGSFSVDYKVSLASVTVKDDTNHIYDVESSFVSGGIYEGEEEREPDITALKQLSKFFGVSIDHILCND